ncbi:hypothetical protein [Neomegalonema sp.]|uniref:hypothetical protein n=1 Tax=Neomegalonema sp. TaxID=2039713 RepID=UPI0026139983|nr:hypothetical protein [Neomegalonema sp.]MDD2870107.1 hypothetical protein [Neomegalonema sp.]
MDFVGERMWRFGIFSVEEIEDLGLRLAEAAVPKKGLALRLARDASRGKRLGVAHWFWGLACFFGGVAEIALDALYVVMEESTPRDAAEKVGALLVGPAIDAIGLDRVLDILKAWSEGAAGSSGSAMLAAALDDALTLEAVR